MHKGPFARHSGFTLFELMVALVVVGVLAAIALPAYFKQVQRSNRSAGEQYMQDLANREEQYRLDSRSYTTSKAALGWSSDPSNVTPNYTVAIATAGNDCSNASVVNPAYVITATAIGSQASDGDLCLDYLSQKTPPNNW